MDKKIYTIGRAGRIFLDDSSVSRLHAELIIYDNKIYLRDCESTNGLFLFKNNRMIPFVEGYVQYNQMVLIGRKKYLICELLDMASAKVNIDFNATDPSGVFNRPVYQTQPLIRRPVQYGREDD